MGLLFQSLNFHTSFLLIDDVIHEVQQWGRPEIRFVNFNIKALIYAYTSSRSTVHSRGQRKRMLITSQEPDFVAIFIATSRELVNLRKPVAL